MNKITIDQEELVKIFQIANEIDDLLHHAQAHNSVLWQLLTNVPAPAIQIGDARNAIYYQAKSLLQAIEQYKKMALAVNDFLRKASEKEIVFTQNIPPNEKGN